MSAERFDLAVVIGRFAPFHRGHEADLRSALAIAARVVVVLGSARHARNPRIPFTWEEREAMLRLCLAPDEQARVTCVPVRDYHDDRRWAMAVQAAIAPCAGDGSRVVVMAGTQPADRLRNWFAGWQPLEPRARENACSATLAGAYLRAGAERRSREASLAGALAVLGASLPAPVAEYLRAWAALPHYAELAEEQAVLDEWRAQWSGTPYEPVFVTVDCVVRAAGHVLLVKRRAHPGKGLWALPGGYLEPRERLLDSALRELYEETRIGLDPGAMRRALERVAVFDAPDRSLRGRTVTHAHFFDLGEAPPPGVKGGDDAAEAAWIPQAQLAAREDHLFEDHFGILDEFLRVT